MKRILRTKLDRQPTCRLHFLSLLAVLIVAGGCSEVGLGPVFITSPQQRYARDGAKMKADPVAALRELADRCKGLEQYRLMFYRQERLGLLLTKLGAMEEIRTSFRQEPFSVRFEWDNEEMPYFESVYVAGQNNDKLIVRERKGIFPFPPQVRVVGVQDPVTFGKAKNPVTYFGLERVTQRTLRALEDPDLAELTSIEYKGVVNLEPINRPAHYLLIQRPKMPGYTYTRQDFYIDAETMLPAGTDLWLPSGQMDARYRYAEVKTDVTLTDEDFRLSKDHPKSKPSIAKEKKDN